MQVDAIVDCPVHDSFRVRQVAGMFDLPLADRCCRRFSVELPDLSEAWQVGVIVGPSGSGKTTIAHHAFGEALYAGHPWPADRAVIDCLGERPIKEITQTLTAVGFSSPPAWIKPYHVLSNGEKFRCDLAQALLSGRELVVFDEFTSVVDRTVAQIGSAAVARAIRSRPLSVVSCPLPGTCNEPRTTDDGRRRFIAVTCHYDVLPWLEPDWVLDMATATLDRRCLRRPPIELEIFRCGHEAWRLFAPHHYLSGELNRSAHCYLATWREEPAAFCGLLNQVGHKGTWRISRIVVLPDYQGIGIGGRLCAAVGEAYHCEGQRVTITTSHPAMVGHLRRSSLWRVSRVAAGGRRWSARARQMRVHTTSAGRTVVSAQYVGAAPESRKFPAVMLTYVQIPVRFGNCTSVHIGGTGISENRHDGATRASGHDAAG
jgi:GNAT superfamily N-acetyltransferase